VPRLSTLVRWSRSGWRQTTRARSTSGSTFCSRCFRGLDGNTLRDTCARIPKPTTTSFWFSTTKRLSVRTVYTTHSSQLSLEFDKSNSPLLVSTVRVFVRQVFLNNHVYSVGGIGILSLTYQHMSICFDINSSPSGEVSTKETFRGAGLATKLLKRYRGCFENLL